ncbi:MAG: CHAT domain-containing protein [Deltaproteobacteria bacterium]|nr:MAG: CHAT domain-containing protein [Deltaproteobacteria bacterium]
MRARLAVAVAGAVVALVVLWLVGRGRGPGASEPPIALATAEIRTIEGRISYPAADRHRSYRVVRASSAAPADTIALDALAALERRGDLHGVAAAYLLLGDPPRAMAYLERATGLDVAADRALVQLGAGHPAEALVALDGVLAAVPRHPQALWNRALALRDLGLVRMAVETFEAVAALGEPGWADEARARARALAEQADERKRTADQIVAAGPRLATAPDGISPEIARKMPGLARLYFYDAVRGAASADAVRALAPLASALDAASGGTQLAGYVERIARADFARRGPLARRYAAVVAGEALDAAAARELLAALRAAKQDDILLGALILTSPDRRTVPPALLPELRGLADATGDAWFRLLAIEQEAGARVARGEADAAEAQLLPALASCPATRLEFRCLRLQLLLGESYRAMLRLADARRVIGDGLAGARRAGESLLEQRFLAQAATLEMLADDVSAITLPLARAYLDELVRRDPRCTTEAWSREELAMMRLNRDDVAGARDELARAAAIAAGCPGHEPDLETVFAQAHVARDAEVAAVRGEIAALRASGSTTPGGQAVLDMTEGMLLISPIGRDRTAGIALLERAIASAGPLAASDVDAHKARSYAYSLLILDAGRAGDWQRVWQLLGAEVGAAIARCGLGVAVEGRRSAVVVRDAAGGLAGSYEASRAAPDGDAAQLVPAALRDRLRGCAEIDVVARPPIQGSPALLPIELAWSYRSAAAPREPVPARAPRLVISDPEPPAALGLPRLVPWRSTVPPDVVLDGAAATPSHVLAALADAGFVEIHAHGVVNAAVSDASFVMLSPDPDGRYALTAAAIRKQPLRGRPIVVLAACHAGATASYRHEPWGLPAAFVAAGARAVIASPDVIADADAGALFDDLRARIAAGASPAIALHDARLAWLAAHGEAAWVKSLVVFQ